MLDAVEVASVSPHDESRSPSGSLSWQEAVAFLDTIPGINARAAQGILAEIGIDMTRFPSAGHLASWAGVCPGNHESAGKRLSGKARKGNPWLRQLLVEAAHAAARTKNTSFASQYYRLAARRSAKKALIAVAHTLLVIMYHLLLRRDPYRDLGSTHFDDLARLSLEKRLVHRLEQLGFSVSLAPVTPAA